MSDDAAAQPRQHVVEIFLPLTDNNGARFERRMFDRVRSELLERFGGVTFFSQNPAEGLWAEGSGDAPSRDEIVVVEVLVDDLDPMWWADYRRTLERVFAQEELLIRAHAVTKL